MPPVPPRYRSWRANAGGMTVPEFECDLEPSTRWPRVRWNFANGWTASVVFRVHGGNGCDAMQASLAACPTGHWQEGKTELGETEATADEVAAYLAQIAARPRP